MPDHPHGPSAGQDLQALNKLLREYLDLVSRAEQRQYLRDHPELLAPAVDRLLEKQSAIQRTEGGRSFFEETRSELKACREMGIERALPDNQEAASVDTAMVRVLLTLMNARSLEAMKVLIRQHPELLSLEADSILQRTWDEPIARHVERYRRLLESCRRMGVDAAFAEVERRREPMPREVAECFLKVITARSLAELEQAVRREPRVIDPKFRTTFEAFLGQNNTLAVPKPHIQQCLRLLHECERNGIDATFARMAQRASADEGPTEVFNSLIRRFNSGGDPAEVARELMSIMPALPEVPRRSSMLLAMLASQLSGNHVEARQLAVRLNQEVRGWDLPGIPGQAMGLAVIASRDLAPILAALEALLRTESITPQEYEAIQSLRQQYAERK